MCLIAVKTPGVDFPQEKYMLHAETRNSDGIGIMYWKNGSSEVNIKKNFINAKHMISWCKENIAKEDSLVIHFRFATHGLKDIGNRHPFPITKNTELLRKPELVCQIAVAHNGVISSYGHHQKFSDTQKFILDILADESIKTNLHSEAVIKLINTFIDGDKLAILHNNGDIQMFGNFEKEEDIYYSNSGYKPYTYGNLLGFRGYGDDYYFDKEHSNNSSIGKVANGCKVPFKGLCEGCNTTTYVMTVELEGDEGTKIEFNLCKKCRRDYKKGKLDLLAEDIESETVCDSCGEFFPTKDLIEIQMEEKMFICETCNKAYIESGTLPN